eukprot:GHUV01034495.1.p1 GENE.GHUV01034495.1~~GHUV01034495.1.p1  ORF type:complete len:134 (+),score=34.87 GHUV01034495.1:421-822(+)
MLPEPVCMLLELIKHWAKASQYCCYLQPQHQYLGTQFYKVSWEPCFTSVCCFLLSQLQVIYINHEKATQLLPDILEQNSIPAAHSKGLLEKYVPVKSVAAESMSLDGNESDTNSAVNDAVPAAEAVVPVDSKL